MKGLTAVVVAALLLAWPVHAEQIRGPHGVGTATAAKQPEETANAPGQPAAAEQLPPPSPTSEVPPGVSPGALPGPVLVDGDYYYEDWYHHDDGDLFPLAGFVPLPDLGVLDPYNLGVTWPLGKLVEEPQLDNYHEPNWLVGRFGWWTTSRSGSSTEVGEWQGLGASPFWDLDGLYTDSVRTYNFTATGLDNETSQGNLEFYGPLFRGKIEVLRFLHRLDHDDIDNIADRPLPVPPGFSGIFKTDLNAGEDYALRVEQLKSHITTDLTDHVKLRVDVFAQRKFGERQANAVAHCFQQQGISGRNCHILTQRQHIDWRTVEVTPRVEGHWGPVVVEYSRLMRQFSQDDQPLFREYTGFRPQIIDGTFPYAIVPDITTQIDQLRVNVKLAQKTRFYGYGYVGRMDDYFRNTNRHLSGYDLRLTDYTLSGLRLTAYTRGYHQTGNLPDTLLPSETQSFDTIADARERLRDPIGFHRTTAGFRGRYLPHLSEPLLSHLALIGGYEYDILNRDNAEFTQSDEAFSFAQPSTITNTIHVGVQQPWTACIDSYTRYRVEFIDNPLHGFRETSGVINTGLPQQRHIVEVGGGWYPAPNFGISGRQEFDLAWHNATNISVVPGNIIDFDEDSYSTTGTVWYAPTEKLALTTSVAFMSNWIDQNITLGDDYIQPDAPEVGLLSPVTRPWFYGGRSTVITTRADYKVSHQVRVYAGYEYVYGRDAIDNRGFVDLWPDLGSYSQVITRTSRILAGVDWNPYELLGVYLRYVYFDYDAVTSPDDSGSVHMLLAGLSLVR
jgi:hypothetical protein